MKVQLNTNGPIQIQILLTQYLGNILATLGIFLDPWTLGFQSSAKVLPIFRNSGDKTTKEDKQVKEKDDINDDDYQGIKVTLKVTCYLSRVLIKPTQYKNFWRTVNLILDDFIKLLLKFLYVIGLKK